MNAAPVTLSAAPKATFPTKVTSCLKDEKCKADLKDPNDKCTLTCVKGTNKETVEGKCVRTYK
jgi:hypothetical protein